jgi:hypothetical protein
MIMFTNPDHYDDVGLSAQEKLAFSQLVASVTPDEIDHRKAEPGPHGLRDRANHQLGLRRFVSRHLGAFGRGMAGVGFALVIAGLAVSLILAVSGLVLVVLGIWCLMRIAERPHRGRDRAVVGVRKMIALFRPR